MKKQITIGHTMDELNTILDGYKDRYEKRDFRDVTILYAAGESETKPGIIEYIPLRPCEMENFQVGMHINSKHICVNFDDIPQAILQDIDPSVSTAANIAFMFEEGTKDETIMFMHSNAVHTMRRLPIEQTNSLTFARMHLLAEDLLLKPDKKVISPKLVTVTDTQKSKRKTIIGFAGADNSLDISEYIRTFLQEAGQNLYMIKDNMESVTVVVYADRPNEVNSLRPCYALTLSDTGYNEPIVACGWIDPEVDNMYIQGKFKSLADSTPDTLQDDIQDALKSFDAVFASHQMKFMKSDQKMVKTDTEIARLNLATKYINKVPSRQDFLGDKKYKKILEKFQTMQTPEMLSEYEAKSTIFHMICGEAEKTYSRKHLIEHAGAELLGIAK